LFNSETSSALGWHVYGGLGSSLVDSYWVTVELGELLGSQLQTTRNGVLVSILNDAVDVGL